ncbi:DUF4595 domain-containing protein [Hoylesella loescheii]|uniref:DUF4595 domain-containing protein n=1 Tax=Hoylesella loescheii TaxID=840 RepID=UPI0028E4BDDE|nr:DUF4595 domain-containing protein [Hoylesella loescheii]
MKKFLTFVCIVATMLGSTATFTSCSTDIDGNSTTNNIRRVFPDKLPKSMDGMIIERNEKGQVVAFKCQKGKNIRNVETNVTLEYKDGLTKNSGQKPDVVVTEKLLDGRLLNVYNLVLNEKGFVRHCLINEYDRNTNQITGTTTMDFAYNADEQLEATQSCENEREGIVVTETFIYQDGDIVEKKRHYSNKPKGKTVSKVYYTSKFSPNPIENKGGVTCFHDSSDGLEYFYYAGLLGKGTKHLPIMFTDDNYLLHYKWEFDSDGYPLAAYLKGYLSKSFTW